ncbi:MAG TPA: choice-of-anchor B family protein [Saprospiraceae bacterium]|nr:choice-of-anchor B family protein [Saprospiraceae bacterium]
MFRWLCLCGVLLYSSLALPAQNLNTTFRSKMTFTGQTLANVWGYSAGGREYALLGARNGLIIVDITDPDNPAQIVQIPGPANLWKEIKTYSHYAYVVSEGGWGVQIIDLSNLPSPNLAYHSYNGDGAINGQFNKAHALHIDTTRGFLYAHGSNLFSGGPVILNLNPDPYNPTFAGKYNQQGYVHDGYADNDTLYAGHIYAGTFAIVDCTDKNNPVVLATQQTPNNFTHNTWPSADKKTLFTTDETSNSFLAAYDISDPTDIKLLDKIQSNPGSSSIVHNTHILNQFAVTSWYKDGFTIVDVTRPANLVQVGNYDTYPIGGSGFDGCWGVYPFFPSGTIIASNINAQGTSNGELFIITPNYVHACWIEGVITDAATGAVLSGAQVSVLGSNPLTQGQSAVDGQYKIGQAQAGLFTVQVSLSGYQTASIPVQLVNGELTALNVALFPLGGIVIDGEVRRFGTSELVSDATVCLFSDENTYCTTTDASGHFSISDVLPGVYDVAASADTLGMTMQYRQVLAANSSLVLELYPYHRRDVANPGTTAAECLAAPNPFGISTRLSFHFSGNTHEISVFDATGKMIERYTPDETDGEIELGKNWAPGVYLVGVGGQPPLKLVKL